MGVFLIFVVYFNVALLCSGSRAAFFVDKKIIRGHKEQVITRSLCPLILKYFVA
jgi:hypothetical protein